jgi:hypothetical protein
LLLLLVLVVLVFTAWIHRPTNATTPTSGTNTQGPLAHNNNNNSESRAAHTSTEPHAV